MGTRTCLHHLLNISNPIYSSRMPPSVVSSLDFRRQQEKSRWGCDWSFLHQDGRLNGNRVYKRDDFIIALGELHVWTEEVTYMTASVLKNRGWWLFYVFMRGEKKGWSFFNDFFHLLIFLIPWVVKLTFCSIFPPLLPDEFLNFKSWIQRTVLPSVQTRNFAA